jgi:hypothetical protein
MEQELKEHLAAMEARINARIDMVDARIEKVETNLLTEFHKWASPVDSKLRTHRSWFYEVDAEVEALKGRMRKLEGGEA